VGFNQTDLDLTRLKWAGHDLIARADAEREAHLREEVFSSSHQIQYA
jgi:hypothetical protein